MDAARRFRRFATSRAPSAASRSPTAWAAAASCSRCASRSTPRTATARSTRCAAALLPPLVYRKGVAGVHLCLADDAASSIETAERKVRADATLVPSWIVLIEGNSRARRRRRRRRPRARAHGARRAGARARGLPARVHAPQDAVERGLAPDDPTSAGVHHGPRSADRIRRCVARGARGLRRHHGHAQGAVGQQFLEGPRPRSREPPRVWASGQGGHGGRRARSAGQGDASTSRCRSPTTASTASIRTRRPRAARA